MAVPRRRRIAGVSATADVLEDTFSLINREEWMSSSACGGMNATAFDIFFPETKQQELEAKAICGRCPVAWQCLDLSIRNREIWGVWGGMTLGERYDLIDKYRGHTSPAAKAAHRLHITELNQRKKTDAHRVVRLRT